MPNAESPRVGVMMGSVSDLPTVTPCLERLAQFGVTYEVRVLSAHRTPEATRDYAREARGRGVQVIVCAAGMAAHLAGAVAAGTTLPVIGIPVPSSAVQGLDALLATVQMPPGVPVATVAIGKAGAANAAVLAVQILALADPALAEALTAYKAELASKVADQDAQLAGEPLP